MSYLYSNFVFNPLYNGLIYLFDTFPSIDAGVAVIIFTIIVRLVLFPLSKKAVITQIKMKEIEPELRKIKSQIKDQQQQAIAVMDLYKRKNVNPFSSILFLFIQLPIIYSLYSIFVKSGLPSVKSELLYSFVSVPIIDMHFLGIVDMGAKSIILAFVAALAQYLQLHFSSASKPSQANQIPDPVSDMTQSMMRNMKFIFPIMVFIISYKISSVVALYWTVSSLFTLAQELVVMRHLRLRQPL